MAERKSDSNPGGQTAARLLPLDALRGLIIILMALDHANYFIAQRHPSGEHWGGTFPSYDSTIAFVTRFVTHLSAPGFFFLMGAGMILFSARRTERGWSYSKIRAHLVLRGAILIVLQFVIINPIWKISPIPFPSFYQGVLVALGGTMIIGVLFIQFQPSILLLATILVSVLIEATHPDPALWGSFNNTPLGLIFGFSGGTQTFWVNYPIIAWLEFVTLGMLFGHWFRNDPNLAFRRAMLGGLLLLVAFVPLRLMNGFGNIRPLQGDTWIDFLNVVKYPPSWSFTFLTMGFNLLMLNALNWASTRARNLVNFIVVYGRVPFFLYVTHLLLYALLGRLLTPNGSSYLLMYALWLAGLAILYPLAVWYARQKTNPSLRPVLQFF